MIGYIAKVLLKKSGFPKIEGFPGDAQKDIVVEVSCIVGAIRIPPKMMINHYYFLDILVLF
ncbi:MAG: hypothetical protein SCALA702_01570 [Melioribacteraceae bacterium]|nr:MAG: hypothetical protein SCALA702_01570 [Melioribacteraceae bacterium]